MTIRRFQPLDCHPAGARNCGVVSLQALSLPSFALSGLDRRSDSKRQRGDRHLFDRCVCFATNTHPAWRAVPLLRNTFSSSLRYPSFAVAPISGARYNCRMRIIARRTLREFWEKHPAARQALQAWYADVKRADWKSPSELKAIYRNASFLANKRVVFN